MIESTPYNMRSLRDDLPQARGPINDDYLIIGLDFGTTFSGIAYGFTGSAGTDKPEVHDIREWPGLEGHDQPKVDTLISYHGPDKRTFDWGAQARDKQPLVGMKLLLDPEQERPLYVPGGNGKQELKKLDKSAEDVAADYIGALHRHAMSRIEARHHAAYLNRCQKKYVLSVPAIWSDKAKDSTLRAAKTAGIHPVTLITEPEAAALYTLHKMSDQSLEIGDALVICDAGGGTVDLISYEITKLVPRLELKPLVPSKGGMAGSLVLNKRFEAEVHNMLGEDTFYALKKKPAWTRAMQDFDRQVKTAFRGDPEEAHIINFPRAKLPDDPENNLEGNVWIMDSQMLHTIFAPVVSEIENLVNEQISQVKVKRIKANHPKADNVKAVFLVGGFGQSEYLKKRLQHMLPDTEVIQPNGAWAAIVKGAVLSELPNEALVTSSIATRHYGTVIDTKYYESMDAGQTKLWDPCDGIWRCSKMTWYIRMGDDLSRNEKISFSFTRTLSADYDRDRDLIFNDSILVSDKAKAPDHPGKDGRDTRKHVTAITDFRTADPSLFRRVRGTDGRLYVKISFQLTLTPQKGLFRFASEINGREYGTVEARYD